MVRLVKVKCLNADRQEILQTLVNTELEKNCDYKVDVEFSAVTYMADDLPIIKYIAVMKLYDVDVDNEGKIFQNNAS